VLLGLEEIKMRHILSIVIASLLLFGLAGCGGTQPDRLEDTADETDVEKGESSENIALRKGAPQEEEMQDVASSTVASDELDESIFTLDGATYQLPCLYGSFAGNGWTIADSAYDEGTAIDGCSSKKIGMLKGGNYVEISITNPTETAKAVDECEVRDIAITRGWLEREDIFSFKNGLTTESSIDDISASMDLTFEASIGYNYARCTGKSAGSEGTTFEFFWYDGMPERNSVFIYSSTKDHAYITGIEREQSSFPAICNKDDITNMELPDTFDSLDTAVFTLFLQGDFEASLKDPSKYDLKYASFGEAGKYTLGALRDAINKNSDRIGDHWGYNGLPFEKICYGIWDTLFGGKALAIKFQNMGIYDIMDCSYAVFVFVLNEDGTLEMTYADDSWCRKEITVLDSGAFSGIGDGGTAKSSWFGFLDAAGQYQEVYNKCIQHNAGISLTVISTPDGEYYDYETDGIDQERLDRYKADMEEQGISYTDNIEDIIQMAYADFGIDPDALRPYDAWMLWSGE